MHVIDAVLQRHTVRGRAVQKICKQLTARPYGMDQKLLSLWTAHMWIMRATADVS